MMEIGRPLSVTPARFSQTTALNRFFAADAKSTYVHCFVSHNKVRSIEIRLKLFCEKRDGFFVLYSRFSIVTTERFLFFLPLANAANTICVFRRPRLIRLSSLSLMYTFICSMSDF